MGSCHLLLLLGLVAVSRCFASASKPVNYTGKRKGRVRFGPSITHDYEQLTEAYTADDESDERGLPDGDKDIECLRKRIKMSLSIDSILPVGQPTVPPPAASAEELNETATGLALYEAVRKLNVELVESVLSRGVNVNEIIAAESTGKRGILNHKRTALFAAIEAGSSQIVSLLLEAGASVDPVGPFGKPAMSFAIDSEASNDILALLIQNGANINQPDPFSDISPIESAFLKSNARAFKFLLAQEAIDVNSCNGSTGRSLLHQIVLFNDCLCLATLLKSGKVNKRSLTNQAAVYEAFINDRAGQVTVLLDYFGNLFKADNLFGLPNNTLTLLHNAVLSGNVKFVRIFAQMPNVSYVVGNVNAVELAVQTGSHETLKALFEANRTQFMQAVELMEGKQGAGHFLKLLLSRKDCKLLVASVIQCYIAARIDIIPKTVLIETVFTAANVNFPEAVEVIIDVAGLDPLVRDPRPTSNFPFWTLLQ